MQICDASGLGNLLPRSPSPFVSPAHNVRMQITKQARVSRSKRIKFYVSSYARESLSKL